MPVLRFVLLNSVARCPSRKTHSSYVLSLNLSVDADDIWRSRRQDCAGKPECLWFDDRVGINKLSCLPKFPVALRIVLGSPQSVLFCTTTLRSISAVRVVLSTVGRGKKRVRGN